MPIKAVATYPVDKFQILEVQACPSPRRTPNYSFMSKSRDEAFPLEGVEGLASKSRARGYRKVEKNLWGGEHKTKFLQKLKEKQAGPHTAQVSGQNNTDHPPNNFVA